MSSEPSKLSRKQVRLVRTLALQLLYGLDQKRFADDGELVVSSLADEDDSLRGADESVLRDAGRKLFDDCCAERTPVDATIDAHLTNWTMHRLAVTDRSLLRLGAYELLYAADKQPRSVINDYVDLAKLYGSDDKTAKLVNGVLDAIGRKHRSDEMKKR